MTLFLETENNEPVSAVVVGSLPNGRLGVGLSSPEGFGEDKDLGIVGFPSELGAKSLDFPRPNSVH